MYGLYEKPVNCETSWMWPTMGHDPGQEEETPAIPKKGAHELAGLGIVHRAQEALTRFPIGDIRPFFTSQLERDIYESTPPGASVPMAPHTARQGPARHLTLSWVAKQAHCNYHEARQLIDCMVPLEATEQMAREFCRWARVRGIQATIEYLERFAIAAAQQEPQDEIEQTFECVPHRAVKVGTRYEIISWIASPAHEEPNPEAIEYHRVGEHNEDSDDWIDKRPWIAEAIDSIKQTKDIAKLKKYGQRLYHYQGYTKDEHRVLWSYYKAQHAYLSTRTAKAMPSLVRSIIDRVQQANSQQLPQVGKAIYNLQTGKAKARCDLSNYWSTIWSAYHQQKARLTA